MTQKSAEVNCKLIVPESPSGLNVSPFSTPSPDHEPLVKLVSSKSVKAIGSADAQSGLPCAKVGLPNVMTSKVVATGLTQKSEEVKIRF